jgi:hypothetical protein
MANNGNEVYEVDGNDVDNVDEYDEYDDDEYDDDGNEDEQKEDDGDNRNITAAIVTKFGCVLCNIDPYEVHEWMIENEYTMSFESASLLDAQYKYWSDGNAEDASGGTRWLAAYNFPHVGSVIKIGDKEFEVTWTGVLTFTAVKIM